MGVMRVSTQAPGDAVTFDGFVAAHGRSLLRLAHTLTGNRSDAEDLLQDALADAYRNWSKVAASHALYAYVRRILVNRHTSRMRKRSASERPVDPTAIPAAAEPDHVTAVAPFAGSVGGKGSRSPRVASSHQGETTNSQVAASY